LSQQALQVAQIVQAVEKAKKRIPKRFLGRVTFFSGYDLWEYHNMMDDRVCMICETHADMETIIGSLLRVLFPYLQIVARDKIMVHEHMPRDDNCRCWLERVGLSDVEDLEF
jgi:hypothetical protein